MTTQTYQDAAIHSSSKPKPNSPPETSAKPQRKPGEPPRKRSKPQPPFEDGLTRAITYCSTSSTR